MKKPAFKIGMAAIEVVVEIVKSFPNISSVFLPVYIPANLKEFVSDRIERHNPPEQTIEVKREIILNGDPHSIFHHLIDRFLVDGKCHLAFSSKIKLRGIKKNLHIPLMDFKCQNLPENLEKVRSFLTKIGQRNGIILDSGQSYHYYGLELLSEKQWRIFMAKCLLSELRDLQLIDVSYVGHSLLDEFAILRISSSPHYPKIPTVVSILD